MIDVQGIQGHLEDQLRATHMENRAYLGGLSQVIDGPHDWEQYRAAADNIYDMQNVPPREPRSAGKHESG